MNKVFIIAEAGVNHNGDIRIAKKMIDVANEAGCDAVKFQTFNSSNLVTENAEKSLYQKENTNDTETQFEMIKKYELNKDQHIKLINYCKTLGIEFLSSPFDLESIDLLNNLDLKIIKIPSGEITNLPYLRKIASLKKEIIISTGMSTLGEIEQALNVLRSQGNREITVLHCNTEYPTPLKDVNLKAMLTIKSAFSLRVGYSDHTKGTEVPIAAVAMGAEVIEKHFTLDQNMKGPDHKASLSPKELKKMVKSIRNIEEALGNGEKKPSESEMKNIGIVRKSIVAKKDIRKGDVFTINNITIKRPGNGISPMLWDEIIGQKSKYNFKEDELIML